VLANKSDKPDAVTKDEMIAQMLSCPGRFALAAPFASHIAVCSMHVSVFIFA